MKEQSRRTFCVSSFALASLAFSGVSGDGQVSAKSSSGVHPDIAVMDRDGILAAASDAMALPIQAICEIPAKRSPGTPNDYYSEPEGNVRARDLGTSATPKAPSVNASDSDPFTAHRDAVYRLGTTVAALTAASVITSEPLYAARAAEHIRAWFITPATRIASNLQYAHWDSGRSLGKFEGVIETVPLAEVARSLRFLAATSALTSEELAVARKWFADYAAWMNASRIGGLARDAKDQHGSSWLFQSAAYADANVLGLTSDDATLNALRHRFHSATLRAEINNNGIFFHVVSSPNPYRDSLLNLDLLCLACETLTTRFDNAWEYELQDGPGMRAAIAFHYPFVLHRGAWPFPADSLYFKELPGRRISLLLAGRAYRQADYVDLWRSLSPLPKSAAPELLRSFPITQPLLWFTQPKTALR